MVNIERNLANAKCTLVCNINLQIYSVRDHQQFDIGLQSVFTSLDQLLVIIFIMLAQDFNDNEANS